MVEVGEGRDKEERGKKMKTYAQAKKPKEGWSHADNESLCAATADIIAQYNYLNPEIVYKWIRKHYQTDWEQVRSMRDGIVPYHNLVGFILGNQTEVAKRKGKE